MENKVLQFHEVVNGKWSSAENFLGECKNGTIVHIYKKQMENIGYKIGNIETIEFPIFVLSYFKKFVNSNGQNANRLTAASIFNSYSKLIEALLEDYNIDS
jgi:hypothetical protein